MNGKFYAFAERCGHMNARLSSGNINQGIVTCPFHGAKFDVTSGKKVGEPILEIPPGMEPLPSSWQKYMEFVGQEMSFIKTYDQETYEVKVEGETIKNKGIEVNRNGLFLHIVSTIKKVVRKILA